MTEWIAERRLLFVPKGGMERKELLIRIGRPYLVEQDNVDFLVSEGTGGCRVEFSGIVGGYSGTVYGGDLLQALQLAVDVEPILKSLRKKYVFFFPSGEPYFEDSENG